MFKNMVICKHIVFEIRGGGGLDMHIQREQGYPDPSIFRGDRENRSSGFPTRPDTNQAVQSQKLGRGLKF